MTPVKCATVGCNKPAEKMKCPTCLKHGIEIYFCSQQCFKSFWPIHKFAHTNTKETPLPEEFRGYQFTGPIRPSLISPKREVPAHIERPEYAISGVSEIEKKEKATRSIEVRTPKEIEAMRVVCKYGREVLDIAGSAVGVGVTTDELDRIVHEASIERNCYPSPLNYYGFPKSCCTSVNEVICHGIPDSRPLQDGDIVNIDISLYHGGFHCDLNETFLVGNVDPQHVQLVKVSRECLEKAIELVKPGTLYREVGNIISKHAQANGCSVVTSYCGHGIGRLFHSNPNVPHYARNKAIGVMKPGHVFTIEPMINQGSHRDVLWPDHWTAVTVDGKRSSQFEHTLLVTDTGVEILTKS